MKVKCMYKLVCLINVYSSLAADSIALWRKFWLVASQTCSYLFFYTYALAQLLPQHFVFTKMQPIL